MPAIILVLAAVTTPTSIEAAGPLADLNFAVGDEHLFSRPAPGGGNRGNGTWSFVDGRMLEGRLQLHFELRPAAQTMPVKSGPAILFAGLHLYGDAGGDVGLGVTIPTVVHKAIPACDDDSDCRYSVDIAIPTDDIPEAIRRLERDGTLMSVGTSLTLVRTYGDGQWLEVLPFTSRPEGIRGSSAGRLGAMAPVEGEMYSGGLSLAIDARAIPKRHLGLSEPLDYAAIAERRRAKVGDSSSALPLVEVDFKVQVHPACPYYSELWLHDDGGNHLFNTLAFGKTVVSGATRMPVGVPWYLTLAGGGGIADPAARLGPIVSDGSPLEVFATFDCDAWSGTLKLVGAAAPSATPTPSAASAQPGTPGPVTVPTPPDAILPPPSPSSTDATAVPALLALALAVVAIGGALAFAAGRGWIWRRR